MKLGAYRNVVILIARLIVGGIFIVAGWMKVSHMPETIMGFSQMGFGVLLTYLASYAELVGGVLLVLGLWTEIAAAVLSVVMIVALGVTYKLGFPMYSAPLTALGGLLAILAQGGGTLSLESIVCKKKTTTDTTTTAPTV